MRKSFQAFVTLAVCVYEAHAENNIAIGGVLVANLKSYRGDSATRQTSSESRIDEDFTSRFWMSGIANSLSNGDAYVYLKGRWERFTIGQHQMMAIEGISVEYDGNCHRDHRIANSLRLQVIAEGVGNLGQPAFLKAHGCLATQGFYCSKPLPCSIFTSLLENKACLPEQKEQGPRISARQSILHSYSTVTLLAKLRGLSTSVPRARAV